MDKKIILASLAVILITAVFGFWIGKKKAIAPAPEIASFEECAAAGYPVAESYPRQCRTPDGKTFTESIGTGSGSGAMGTVTMGPTCPVERIPPDPACAPRPYQTSITITKNGFSKQINSDSAGRFKVDLDPGTYEFQAKGGAMLPRCGPISVEIKPQSFAWAPISCDTGIR